MIRFVITLVSVLKSVEKENVFLKVVLKCFCVGAKKVVLSKHLRTYLLILKNVVLFPLSFRQCYPTISE